MTFLTYSDNRNNFSKIVKKKQYIESDPSKELLKDMFSWNKIWKRRLKFSFKVVKQANAQFFTRETGLPDESVKCAEWSKKQWMDTFDSKFG